MVMRPNARIAVPALVALAALGGCASGYGSALSAKDPGFASADEGGGRARLASNGAATGGGSAARGPIYVSGNVYLPQGPARSGRPGSVGTGIRAVASNPLAGGGARLSAPAVNADVSLRAGRLADAELALAPTGARADLAIGDPLAGVGRKGVLRLTGGRPAGAGGLSGPAADATGALIGAGKGASAAANDNAADRLLRKALRKAKRTGLIGG